MELKLAVALVCTSYGPKGVPSWLGSPWRSIYYSRGEPYRYVDYNWAPVVIRALPLVR